MAISNVASSLHVRDSRTADVRAIRTIYNQGIEDRLATLEEEPKSEKDIGDWYVERHGGRFVVIVAERNDRLVGWASLNQYSHRCVDRGVADLSIYVERAARATGVGTALLWAIESRARQHDFHKIVVFALAVNAAGLRLYRKVGYRDVGLFKEHGRLDGAYVDVAAMEKILKPLVLFVCKHNTGRSQMAEAYLRNIAGDAVEVASAGTIAADRADPGVVAAMAEDGIDISAARPKLLDEAIVSRADRIITMGCDVEGVSRIDDDWGLPDPKGETLERLREIRGMVRQKVEQLVASLALTR